MPLYSKINNKQFDDVVVNGLETPQDNVVKKRNGMKNLAQKLRKTVGREKNYVRNNVDDNSYPADGGEIDREFSKNAECCKVRSPKDLYGARLLRRTDSGSQVRSSETSKQSKGTKWSAKMELRSGFGSNKDTVTSPLIHQAQLSTDQASNEDSKEMKVVSKSKLKRFKDLAKV